MNRTDADLRRWWLIGLVVAAHALDLATFALAVEGFRVPITQERNALMAGAYGLAGIGGVALTEIALVVIMVYVCSRVRDRPLLPVVLVGYSIGVLGTVANLAAIG